MALQPGTPAPHRTSRGTRTGNRAPGWMLGDILLDGLVIDPGRGGHRSTTQLGAPGRNRTSDTRFRKDVDAPCATSGGTLPRPSMMPGRELQL